MSEFTLYAVDFYELTIEAVAVIEAEVAPPLMTIINEVLKNEAITAEGITAGDICVDHRQPASRLRELVSETAMFADPATASLRSQALINRLDTTSNILAILVDAPEAPNYFVVETRHAHVPSVVDALVGM